MNNTKIIEEFFKILKTDEGYFQSWKDNIAMSFQDAYNWSEDKNNIHLIANKAANTFLNNLLEKKCDWMDIAEKLYHLKNPNTTKDTPSFAYEIIKKWYNEWQKTEDKDFYLWCITNKTIN